jgi:hypothetical protein
MQAHGKKISLVAEEINSIIKKCKAVKSNSMIIGRQYCYFKDYDGKTKKFKAEKFRIGGYYIDGNENYVLFANTLNPKSTKKKQTIWAVRKNNTMFMEK